MLFKVINTTKQSTIQSQSHMECISVCRVKSLTYVLSTDTALTLTVLWRVGRSGEHNRWKGT